MSDYPPDTTCEKCGKAVHVPDHLDWSEGDLCHLCEIRELEQEILRHRTTENAAAHALDVLRQELGLYLIQGEHPMNTRKRISAIIKTGKNNTKH